jgi:hypothetical protein
MNRTKMMSIPSSPPSTGNRPGTHEVGDADRTAGQSRKGESQAAAGARVRAQVRDVARRAGAKPYDAG